MLNSSIQTHTATFGASGVSAPDVASSKQTRATRLLGQIRQAIISGRLAPGERLVVGALADVFDEGQTPVRESLMKLASEGYVIQEDQRGFTVAPVSRSELLHLTQMRVEIESLAVRWSIQHGDDAWEAGVLAATHRLLKLNKLGPDGHSIDLNWSERHLAFHQALVAGCPNLVLLQMRGLLSDRAERYRHLAVRYLKAPRNDRAEHEAMSNAVLSRDSTRAEELMRAHIETTSRILLNEIDEGSLHRDP